MPKEGPRLQDVSNIPLSGDALDYMEKRFDYDSDGNVIYIGYNRQADADPGDKTWLLVHLEYDEVASQDVVTRFRFPDDGQFFKYDWTGRATYFS